MEIASARTEGGENHSTAKRLGKNFLIRLIKTTNNGVYVGSSSLIAHKGLYRARILSQVKATYVCNASKGDLIFNRLAGTTLTTIIMFQAVRSLSFPPFLSKGLATTLKVSTMPSYPPLIQPALIMLCSSRQGRIYIYSGAKNDFLIQYSTHSFVFY